MNIIILKHKLSEMLISSIFILLIWGWVLNLIKLMTIDFQHGIATVFSNDSLVLIRFIGVLLMPLGGIMGYF